MVDILKIWDFLNNFKNFFSVVKVKRIRFHAHLDWEEIWLPVTVTEIWEMGDIEIKVEAEGVTIEITGTHSPSDANKKLPKNLLLLEK